jgi:hypothetical protein
MELTRMTVCDAKGRHNYKNMATDIETVPYALYGDDIYRFYASPAAIDGEGALAAAVPGLAPTALDKIHVVTLVMPLGGEQTGLGRIPKLGEQVLVGAGEGGEYFLMGYLPSAKQSFESKDELVKQEELGLTYKQSGRTAGNVPSGEESSRLTFSKRQTQWRVPQNSSELPHYVSTSVAAGHNPPIIDYVQLHSTGDMEESAANWHKTKAKRVEILAGVDDAAASASNGEKLEIDHSDTTQRAFGDGVDQYSMLQSGDVHVRAKERIILKAGSEIRLQVGRSEIIITDSGIIIASRKTRSKIKSNWDSQISVDSNAGTTIYGQHLNLYGGIDFWIHEGYGGSIKSQMGIMRLIGLDLRMGNFNGLHYTMETASKMVDWATNAAALAGGSANPNSKAWVGALQASSLVDTAFSLIWPVLQGFTASGAAAPSDKLGGLMDQVSLLCTISKITRLAIDFSLPDRALKAARDGLNSAFALLEYGYCLTAATVYAAGAASSFLWEGSIYLGTGGKGIIDVYDLNIFTTNENDVMTTLAAVDTPTPSAWNKVRDGLKDMWGKRPTWAELLCYGMAGAGALSDIALAHLGFAATMNAQDTEALAKL